MNKLFKSIIATSVGVAMVIGVNVALEASRKNVIPVQAAETAGSTTINTVSNTTITTDNYFQIVFARNSSESAPAANATRVRCYAVSNSTSGTTITVSTKAGVNNKYITGISISGSNVSGKGNLAFTFSGSTTSTSSTRGTYPHSATWASSSQLTSVTATATGASSASQGDISSITVSYVTVSSDKTISSFEVEPEDGETVNLNGNGETSVSSSLLYEITYSDLTSGYDVEISCSSPGFSCDDDGNGTAVLTFANNDDYDVTVSADSSHSATITYSVEGLSVTSYELVTSTSQLKAGKELIIVKSDASLAIGTYAGGNNIPAVSVAEDAADLFYAFNLPSEVTIFTLGGSNGEWTFKTSENEYLHDPNTSGKNYLYIDSTEDTWDISISSGVATIQNVSSSKYLKNNGNMFACYTSGQNDVSIYMVPSADPSIEITVTGETSLGVGESAKLTATKINGASGTVNWSTSNSSALSISSSTGDEITVTAGSILGPATITASLNGCNDVQTVFTVRGGTLARPYTIAEAKAAIDSGEGVENVYVAGIISQIDSFNSTYSSITYWISDDGSTTNQFEVYSGKGLNGADFESKDDVAIGASVVVFGNIQKHNDTYEFNYDNELASYSYDESIAIRRQIEVLDSFASLSYNFEKNGSAVLDLLNNANTINDSTTTYGEWTNESTGADYSGQSAGSNGSIQFRTNNNNSGLVTTDKQSVGLFAKKIYIKWNSSTSDGRKLDVYGKDGQYSSPADLYTDAKGTKVGTFTYDKNGSPIQVIAIDDDYEYIGIRSNDGALYLDSIVIQWGEVSYIYDDVAIRLGGKLSKELWNNLNSKATIEGYGVLLSNAKYLGDVELKTKYDSIDGINVKKFDMPLATKAPVSDGDDYYWNLYKGVTNSLTTDFVAVAYIRTSKGVVFLKQITASTKSLANDMINVTLKDLDSFEGSLANLACQVKED